MKYGAGFDASHTIRNSIEEYSLGSGNILFMIYLLPRLVYNTDIVPLQEITSLQYVILLFSLFQKEPAKVQNSIIRNNSRSLKAERETSIHSFESKHPPLQRCFT